MTPVLLPSIFHSLYLSSSMQGPAGETVSLSRQELVFIFSLSIESTVQGNSCATELSEGQKLLEHWSRKGGERASNDILKRW